MPSRLLATKPHTPRSRPSSKRARSSDTLGPSRDPRELASGGVQRGRPCGEGVLRGPAGLGGGCRGETWEDSPAGGPPAGQRRGLVSLQGPGCCLWAGVRHLLLNGSPALLTFVTPVTFPLEESSCVAQMPGSEETRVPLLFP